MTLAASTLLYVLLWQIEAPFWQWAVVSILIGLGFTFFSGAVEAWLVDALTATGFTGRDGVGVRARPDRRPEPRCSTGSVAGGFIAQQTESGGAVRAPRGRPDRDVRRSRSGSCTTSGSRRRRADGPLAEMRKIVVRVGRVRLAGARSQVADGRGAVHRRRRHLRLLRATAILLELYGDPEAYQIAGLVAAIVAGAQIVGGLAAPRIRRLFRRRTSALIVIGGAQRRHARPDRAHRELLGGDRADRRLGAAVRGRDADSPDLPQRADPVATAGDDPLVRLPDGLRAAGSGRSRCSAAPPTCGDTRRPI